MAQQDALLRALTLEERVVTMRKSLASVTPANYALSKEADDIVEDAHRLSACVRSLIQDAHSLAEARSNWTNTKCDRTHLAHTHASIVMRIGTTVDEFKRTKGFDGFCSKIEQMLGGCARAGTLYVMELQAATDEHDRILSEVLAFESDLKTILQQRHHRVQVASEAHKAFAECKAVSTKLRIHARLMLRVQEAAASKVDLANEEFAAAQSDSWLRVLDTFGAGYISSARAKLQAAKRNLDASTNAAQKAEADVFAAVMQEVDAQKACALADSAAADSDRLVDEMQILMASKKITAMALSRQKRELEFLHLTHGVHGSQLVQLMQILDGFYAESMRTMAEAPTVVDALSDVVENENAVLVRIQDPLVTDRLLAADVTYSTQTLATAVVKGETSKQLKAP